MITGHVGMQATAYQGALPGNAVAVTMPAASSNTTQDTLGSLSPRQRDVLNLMMQGQSNKGICRILKIAEPTVKNHVTAVLRALNVTSRTEAVIKVVKASVASMSYSRMPCTYVGYYIPVPSAPLTVR